MLWVIEYRLTIAHLNIQPPPKSALIHTKHKSLRLAFAAKNHERTLADHGPHSLGQQKTQGKERRSLCANSPTAVSITADIGSLPHIALLARVFTLGRPTQDSTAARATAQSDAHRTTYGGNPTCPASS